MVTQVPTEDQWYNWTQLYNKYEGMFKYTSKLFSRCKLISLYYVKHYQSVVPVGISGEPVKFSLPTNVIMKHNLVTQTVFDIDIDVIW